MNLLTAVRIAMRSIARNPLRSFLTVLGIVIGVAAVIAMLAVGKGAKDAIKAQIAALGTNVVMVIPGAFTQGGVRQEAGTASRLTEDDAIAISRSCPSVHAVTPIARSSAQVKYQNQNWRTTVYGAYSQYLDIRDWPVASGASYATSDERGTKVCLLGQTVATNLFGAENPIGAVVRIRNLPFTVAGVLETKGQNAMGQDQDDVVLAPFATVQRKLLGASWVGTIIASAVSEDAVETARQEINETLMARRKNSTGDGSDYTIRTQSEISAAAQQTARTMSILLASIAAVSLIVGGIGIMNIMLVSVAERTREIGIRMAVGATGADILMQFLVEAVVLSVFGGVIGILVGVSASSLIAVLQHWPVAVSGGAIGLGFSFAAVIGVFFGWYPARQASALNPIDALRYE
jgi:putative ABC transport system permease protein